jgi:hypothetical protein
MITKRELHPSKQSSKISSTEEGISIDESDERLQNALLSIHESLESDSNVIVERDLDPKKHLWQICFTEAGRQIAR